MEILVALMILVIASVGLVSLFTVATRAHRKAIDQTNAALLATSILADVRTDMAQGKLPPIGVIGEQSIHFPQYRYDIDVRRIKEIKDAVLVIVTIKPNAPGARPIETFTTVLLRGP